MDKDGGEKMLGMGDMQNKKHGKTHLSRIHGEDVEDREILREVDQNKKNKETN